MKKKSKLLHFTRFIVNEIISIHPATISAMYRPFNSKCTEVITVTGLKIQIEEELAIALKMWEDLL